MVDVVNDFSAPTEFSNVVLVVEGKKLHVNKDYLAIHSPVFGAMFFGSFAKNGKKEVEIKNVGYNKFVDLLNVIYPGWFAIRASSVSYILKLADQFEIKDARDQAEMFLLKTRKVQVTIKLFLADKYSMPRVEDKCLESFTHSQDMAVLKSSPVYFTLSDAMKAAICNKVLTLISNECDDAISRFNMYPFSS